ncbi:MAG: sigma-54-dependent Fis family transcriptional regulator, partial [Gammaproteobacteria bacterium]|nr:sigma-54-dependent Fis family transcriptional regulator [Gammaproteobacteria bacterium]
VQNAVPQPGMNESEKNAVQLDNMALPIDEHLSNIEKNLIQDALVRSGGNITRAAELLGTTFRSLRYKIKKLNID